MPLEEYQAAPSEPDDGMQLVIHAVHGTWPYGILKQWCLKRHGHRDALYVGSEIPWFLEQSEFAQNVLKNHPARWLAFKWSGANSFTARADAISAFREQLAANLQIPHTRHIIIAHSHGGTVAAAAVVKSSEPELAKIDGIVTMGAPFITLKDADDSAAKKVKLLVSQFGFLILFVYLFCFFLAWRLVAPNYLGTGLVFLVIGLLLLMFHFQDRRLREPGGCPSLNLFSGVHPLKRPLVALRAPRDEARLAIAAAQLFGILGDWIWSFTVLLGVGWLNKFFVWAKAARYRATAVALCVFGLAGIAGWYFADIAHMGPGYFGDWRDPAIFTALVSTVIISMVLPSYALVVILVIIPFTVLTMLPGIVLLRFATGREATRFAGFYEIECEDVPSGMRAMVETLSLEAGERAELARRKALRHSFHELSAARKRVADLIDEWTTPRGDPLHDIKEGGRDCDLPSKSGK
jgi:hypothetical protein